MIRHATFLSCRIAGTDGVSLETKKWAEVLSRMGITCSFIAGECDENAELTRIIPNAHFNCPEVRAISDEAFSREVRSEDYDSFFRRLQSFFADTPYELVRDLELHYQNVLFIVFKLVGFYVKAEYHTSQGRIDLVL